MLKTYHPSESELMEEARHLLRQRIANNAPSHPAAARIEERCDSTRLTPDTAARRKRSLQTCHRHNLYELPRHPAPAETGAYVPELSAGLENDRNLTDGARRCARKLAEIIYRQNREGRFTEITVTYLMRALHRSRRTVQRYLRVLEREGYIDTAVIRGARSRLCTGLLIALRRSLLARHHKKRWPGRQGNPGASQESQNQSLKDSSGEYQRLSVQEWSLTCMDGVYRALMKTIPHDLWKDRPPRTASSFP